jgi:hypothetical protein
MQSFDEPPALVNGSLIATFSPDHDALTGASVSGVSLSGGISDGMGCCLGSGVRGAISGLGLLGCLLMARPRGKSPTPVRNGASIDYLSPSAIGDRQIYLVRLRAASFTLPAAL